MDMHEAGWSKAETWLRMQLSYDLWHAKRRADGLNVIRFEAPEPA